MKTEKTIHQLLVEFKSECKKLGFNAEVVLSGNDASVPRYLENIDTDIIPIYSESEKDIIPFYSKSENYLEVLEKMKVGDSFEFPEKDIEVVTIHQRKQEGVFSIRKTGVKFYRIWRLI